jgi:hypothetical protein
MGSDCLVNLLYFYWVFQDSSFRKDGKYIFSQGGSTMIQASIQSLLHSILGDGWLVN